MRNALSSLAQACWVELVSEQDPSDRVPGGWWHTTDELQLDGGRERARELLATFRVPDETCVVVNKTSIADDDKDGLKARRDVLRRLLTALHDPLDRTHPPVELVVAEEQREARKNNFDRAVRKGLIMEGAIPDKMRLVQASPGSEHLLWLPDLVCSAYRQKITRGQDDLYAEITDLTRVIEVR